MMRWILYVEDNEDQAEAVVWRLRRKLGDEWGIDPYITYDEGVAAIKSDPQKWTACFVDLDLHDRRGYGQMKGMEHLDGVRLAKLIKELSPTTPVVLVSASVEEEELDFAPDVRTLFHDFIDKTVLENSEYNQLDPQGHGIAAAIYEKIKTLGVLDA